MPLLQRFNVKSRMLLSRSAGCSSTRSGALLLNSDLGHDQYRYSDGNYQKDHSENDLYVFSRELRFADFVIGHRAYSIATHYYSTHE